MYKKFLGLAAALCLTAVLFAGCSINWGSDDNGGGTTPAFVPVAYYSPCMISSSQVGIARLSFKTETTCVEEAFASQAVTNSLAAFSLVTGWQSYSQEFNYTKSGSVYTIAANGQPLIATQSSDKTTLTAGSLTYYSISDTGFTGTWQGTMSGMLTKIQFISNYMFDYQYQSAGKWVDSGYQPYFTYGTNGAVLVIGTSQLKATISGNSVTFVVIDLHDYTTTGSVTFTKQ